MTCQSLKLPCFKKYAAIIEATWRYPDSFIFHSHGFQEEHGYMGNILVKEIIILPNDKECFYV